MFNCPCIAQCLRCGSFTVKDLALEGAKQTGDPYHDGCEDTQTQISILIFDTCSRCVDCGSEIWIIPNRCPYFAYSPTAYANPIHGWGSLRQSPPVQSPENLVSRDTSSNSNPLGDVERCMEKLHISTHGALTAATPGVALVSRAAPVIHLTARAGKLQMARHWRVERLIKEGTLTARCSRRSRSCKTTSNHPYQRQPHCKALVSRGNARKNLHAYRVKVANKLPPSKLSTELCIE
ncbi:hypothetical protein VTK73DRAFT_5031 [Phialemonium thermophilum]|uniref:Uncharacterized protein n=1 Tax=Phialemonium thermophilum TaxID=223376 RepID=A0ABR3WQU7_9PEZI